MNNTSVVIVRERKKVHMAEQASQPGSSSSHGSTSLMDMEDFNMHGRSARDVGVGDNSVYNDSPIDLTTDQDSTDQIHISKVRGVSPVILKLDGTNWTSWRCVIPSILDSAEYALAVTKGTLIPPAPPQANTNAGKALQKKYDAGNRAARCILFSSMQASLAVALFSHNSDTVEAPDMWRAINERFSNTNGGLKQLAISKLMMYRYIENKSAGENLFRFNQILNRIALLGVKIPDDLKITILLEALPKTWEPFRQAFTAREDSAKAVTNLIEAIENEALRRGKYDTQEVTALFSRLNPSGKKRRRKGSRHNNKSGERSSNVTCFHCHKQGHMKAQCRSLQKNNGPGSSKQQSQQKNKGNKHQKRQQKSQAQANVSEALIAEGFIAETDHFEGNTATSSQEYVVDSGSNIHMTNDRSHMIDYTPYRKPREVKLGGARTLSAQGVGKARITFDSDGQPTTVILNEVLYVPKLRRNLISVSQLTDDGFSVRVQKDSMILTQGETMIQAERKNGLYLLNTTEFAEINIADSRKKKKVSLTEMHRAFAHINVETLKAFLQREGYEVINDFISCDSCIEGKMHRASFRSKPASARAPRIGWINSDTCAVSTTSYGRHNHFLTLTDDYSRFYKVYFIKSKDEVADCI